MKALYAIYDLKSDCFIDSGFGFVTKINKAQLFNDFGAAQDFVNDLKLKELYKRAVIVSFYGVENEI